MRVFSLPHLHRHTACKVPYRLRSSSIRRTKSQLCFSIYVSGSSWVGLGTDCLESRVTSRDESGSQSRTRPVSRWTYSRRRDVRSTRQKAAAERSSTLGDVG